MEKNVKLDVEYIEVSLCIFSAYLCNYSYYFTFGQLQCLYCLSSVSLSLGITSLHPPNRSVICQGSRRVYELEVRNQAEALEKQLRRGAFKDSLVGSLALAR